MTHNLQTHYDELLRVIAEVGKDVKPGGGGRWCQSLSLSLSLSLSADIALARTTLRDCLLDIERLNHTHSQK